MFNSSISLATDASPRAKAELVSDSSAPLLSVISEVARTFISISQHQQNVKSEGQAVPDSEFLGYDEQTREKDIKFLEQDESTIIEAETQSEGDGWDADETLVEDQTPSSLEMAAFIGKFCGEKSTRKAEMVPKGQDGPLPLEIEALSALGDVSRA